MYYYSQVLQRYDTVIAITCHILQQNQSCLLPPCSKRLKIMVHTKKTTLTYNTRNDGLTKSMLIADAGNHNFPIYSKCHF
mmetsp:Transcript_20779/g.37748  ORF Transcript_20779/g.37748 Transcript_20779/m.37748 type:complete len:80 (+) Transcript_20779:160-399(+)